MQILMQILTFMPMLIFSVVLHEVSHGVMAKMFGDETASEQGRLTLNPLPHMDPLGSVVVPVICALTHMPVFGWAKPVPINPNRFTHYKSGVIWVSLAGPLSNLVIAMTAVVLLYFFSSQSFMSDPDGIVFSLLNGAIFLNLVLAVFNLVPIPPLDGSKVLSVLLPASWSQKLDALEPYGFFILMGLMSMGVLGRVIYPTVLFIYRLMLGTLGL